MSDSDPVLGSLGNICSDERADERYKMGNGHGQAQDDGERPCKLQGPCFVGLDRSCCTGRKRS